MIERIARCVKENLDLPNHLLGNLSTYLKLFFRNMQDLGDVKRALMPAIRKNAKSRLVEDTYAVLAQ